MSPQEIPIFYSSERLAYWYFRLNGFLTTENFIVHPDSGRNQRTDADLLAVRFAHRQENLVRPMDDDPKVTSCNTFANIIIAEVKRGSCALNGPWTNPGSENMKRVLKSVGCLLNKELDKACALLYQKGIWTGSAVTIRLFAIGENRDESLCIPSTHQLQWGEMIRFCIGRFRDYQNQKSSVGQWADDGRQLMTDALSADAESKIRNSFCLRPLEDNGVSQLY